MALEFLHQQLNWPAPDDIRNPTGAGPQVYAQLVRQKIESPLRRLSDGRDVIVGILTANSKSDDTEPLIAIVCEFPNAVSQATLREAHKLAWNFCRSPLLVTIEPHLVRVWSCYEKPDTAEAALFDSFEPVTVVEMQDHVALYLNSA